MMRVGPNFENHQDEDEATMLYDRPGSGASVLPRLHAPEAVRSFTAHDSYAVPPIGRPRSATMPPPLPARQAPAATLPPLPVAYAPLTGLGAPTTRPPMTYSRQMPAYQVSAQALYQRPSPPPAGLASVLERPSRSLPTEHVRRLPKSVFRLGFAGVCVLVGITIGSVIEIGARSKAAAAPAPASVPVAAPVRVTAPVAVAAPVAVPVPVAVAAPVPVAAPVAVPAPAAVAAPAVAIDRVQLRIDSEPAGAQVTLVERGNTTLLGVTPIITDVDPTHTYDLVLALDNYQTRSEHVDPMTNTHVAITLAPVQADAPAPVAAVANVVSAPAPAAPPAPVAAPVHHPHHAVAAAPVGHVAAAAGHGVLKVSAKPVCKIIIDGRGTGLSTPQIAIQLPAGHHNITLVNADEGIHLTTGVDIAAGHATPLIQDFTK